MSLPRIPRPNLSFSLPRLSLGGPRLGGLPSLGGPGGGLGFGTVLLWVAVVVVIALLVWRFARRGSGRGPQEVRPDGWRLGAWPVDPSRVTTRAQLIQAFEYLALLRLGADARAWNHLAIADHLPGAGEAARELAGLYEHARYAPGEEPMPAAEMASARRNLCLLAGVANA